LGGFGIVAHPDSPKLELRWREWSAPFDAIEMLNPDTSWRIWAQEPGWRPKQKLCAALAQRRRVVAVAGADAHAKLVLRNADPGEGSLALPLPGYESAFRLLSVHVRPERALSGNPSDDGPVVIRAIRAGR